MGKYNTTAEQEQTAYAFQAFQVFSFYQIAHRTRQERLSVGDYYRLWLLLTFGNRSQPIQFSQIRNYDETYDALTSHIYNPFAYLEGIFLLLPYLLIDFITDIGAVPAHFSENKDYGGSNSILYYYGMPRTIVRLIISAPFFICYWAGSHITSPGHHFVKPVKEMYKRFPKATLIIMAIIPTILFALTLTAILTQSSFLGGTLGQVLTFVVTHYGIYGKVGACIGALIVGELKSIFALRLLNDILSNDDLNAARSQVIKGIEYIGHEAHDMEKRLSQCFHKPHGPLYEESKSSFAKPYPQASQPTQGSQTDRGISLEQWGNS